MRQNRWLALGGILFIVASLNACSSDASAPAATVTPDSGEQLDAQPEASGDAAQEGSADGASDGQGGSNQDASEDVAQEQSLEAGADALDDATQDSAQDAAPDTDDGLAPDAPAEGGDPDAACVPLAGLGEVTCTCNGLGEAQWNSSSPFIFEEHIDFGTTGWDKTQLTPGGLKVFETPNLGGSSLESEATAFEMLARCDFATLIKTEAEIDYQDANGKKTDILVQIDGRKVGVSVVRAYHYPASNPYTIAEATTILTKKLHDIPLSAGNAVPADAWERSILGVVAWDQQYADSVIAAWNALDPTLRGDVIMVLTVTDGNDAALY